MAREPRTLRPVGAMPMADGLNEVLAQLAELRRQQANHDLAFQALVHELARTHGPFDTKRMLRLWREGGHASAQGRAGAPA